MASPLGPRTRTPGRAGTHLLERWSLGVSPYSPNRVMKTLASVPAQRTSPVATATSYTGGAKERQVAGSGKENTHTHENTPESYMDTEKPQILPAPHGMPSHKGLYKLLLRPDTF